MYLLTNWGTLCHFPLKKAIENKIAGDKEPLLAPMKVRKLELPRDSLITNSTAIAGYFHCDNECSEQ